MKASIQALENIAKEMKKKGIQKISMVGKTDPKTVDKMKSMDGMGSEEDDSELGSMLSDVKKVVKSTPSEESDTEEESASHELATSDTKEDAAEGEPHDDQAFKDKLAAVRKLLRGQ